MIIGIGGVSNAGKSSLAKQLQRALSPVSIAIICQDNYTIPTNKIRKTGDHIDWEAPQSIDFKAFRTAISEAGKSHDHVIAEGLLALFDNETTALYDKLIYLKISKETFFNRKQLDLRWGKEPEWYIKHIWQSFERYGMIQNGVSDVLVIDAEKPFDINAVTEYLFA